MLWIAHAVDRRFKFQAYHGSHQELAQLFAALAVAPVANPHQSRSLAISGRGQKTRCRPPRATPHPLGPAPPQVNFRDRAAIREHAIVAGEIVSADALRLGDGSMVRIVEEQTIVAVAPAVRANPLD